MCMRVLCVHVSVVQVCAEECARLLTFTRAELPYSSSPLCSRSLQHWRSLPWCAHCRVTAKEPRQVRGREKGLRHRHRDESPCELLLSPEPGQAPKGGASR